MEEGLNPDIIKATQSSLGKFIKRPPLTEKLLKKPPFRFLHDIITTVLKTTGFFEGLFEEEELISDNVKDRESKIHFLNKVITVLGFATGKTLTVKPSKIVAGQEPAKTNELLQYLGQALEEKLPSSEAVKKYKASIKNPDINDKKNKDAVKVVKKNHDIKKVSSKGVDKTISNEKDTKTIPKLRLRENTTVKPDLPPKKSKTTTNLKKNLGKNSQNDTNSPSNEKYKQEKILNLKIINEPVKITETTEKVNDSVINERDTKVLNDEKLSQQNNNDKEQTNFTASHSSNLLEKSVINITELEKHDQNKKDCLDTQQSLDNTIIKEESDKNKIYEEKKPLGIDNKNEISYQSTTSITTSESNVVNTAEKRPQSVRPSSSRPGAPRVKEKHDSAFVGPETPILHKVNIIVENTVPEEEEDGSIIIVENQAYAQREEQIQLSSNEHGHLVQQILDSQKEYSQISGKTEIEWQFGMKKARDVINQEFDQVRFNVQALSRICNPLGKLIDHIQEDVEVMRQELQEWTRKYEDTSKELIKQKIENVESLQPLQAKIKQLDADIEERHEKMNDLRIVVFKNYYRIEKLLSNGNVQ